MYKSSTFLDEPETGLWVVVFTERIVQVCAALMLAMYSECRLWYVPTDIIAFARELWLAMEVLLGSIANVREVLELRDVIEATEFDLLPDQWRHRQPQAIDYHP